MTTKQLQQIEADHASTNFYIIPYDGMTPSQRRAYIQAVIAWTKRRHSEVFGVSINTLASRPLETNRDLGLNAANQEDWRLPLLTLGTVATWINNNLVSGQSLVIYGFGSEEAMPAVAELRFWQGAQTGLVGRYQIESVYTNLQPSGFFSTPIYYNFSERLTVFIEVVPRLTVAAGNRLQLFGQIVESKGRSVV